MSDVAGRDLPPWAEPYRPYFDPILRVIDLSEGFILMPIEVPGPDVSRALGQWLGARGHSVVIVEPASEQQWRELASTLLSTALDENGVVLLIASNSIEDAPRGLRLLNQRRDSVAWHLRRPLLWCGSREFLGVTWRDAPDFWSIADVPRLLPSIYSKWHRRQPQARTWTFVYDSRSAQELQLLYENAKMQGDQHNAASIGLTLVHALARESQIDAARRLVAELRGKYLQYDKSFQIETRLASGQLALAAGDVDTAEADLVYAMKLAPRAEQEAAVLQSLGEVYSRTERAMEAEGSLRRALSFHRIVADNRNAARTLLALGEVSLQTGQLSRAEHELREALSLYQRVGHERGRASVQLALGRVLVYTARFDEAETLFHDTLTLSRNAGDRQGEAGALTELAELARIRQQERAAFDWFLPALSLYRELDDIAEIAHAHTKLARTALAAGHALHAAILAVLAGRALKGLARPADRRARLTALTEVARALDVLGDAGARSAVFLAWACARLLGEPLESPLADMFAKHHPDLDPTSTPPRDAITAHETIFANAIAACEARLREGGGDPYVLPGDHG